MFSVAFLHPRAFSAHLPFPMTQSPSPLVSQPMAEVKDKDGARGKHADTCRWRQPDETQTLSDV